MMLNDELAHGALQLGLELDANMQQQLLTYLQLLQKWNKVYNLTAIRDPQQMMTHHLLDSLAIVPHLWSGRWLDVGCGAGLPGMMMAICRPDWQVVMLDSNSKKTSFVQQAIIQLGLKNASVQCVRVEAYLPEEKFDGITSRAYSELANFLAGTRHLIAPNGRWAAMKGVPEQEISVVPAEYQIEKVIPLAVPQLDAARCLVIVKSERST